MTERDTETETETERNRGRERKREKESVYERVKEIERLHAFTHHLFIPFISFSNLFTFSLSNMLSIYLSNLILFSCIT